MTFYRESTRSAYGPPGMLVIIFATVPVVVLTATATEQTSITEYDRLKYKLNLTIEFIAIVTFSLSFSLSYSVMLYFKLNVMVIYLCIHFLLGPVEGLSHKPKYRTNIFYSLFLILFLLLTLLLAVRISLLFINFSNKNRFVATATNAVPSVDYYFFFERLPNLPCPPFLNTAGHSCFIFSRQQFVRTF